jgi:hypothetical protein
VVFAGAVGCVAQADVVGLVAFFGAWGGAVFAWAACGVSAQAVGGLDPGSVAVAGASGSVASAGAADSAIT